MLWSNHRFCLFVYTAWTDVNAAPLLDIKIYQNHKPENNKNFPLALSTILNCKRRRKAGWLTQVVPLQCLQHCEAFTVPSSQRLRIRAGFDWSSLLSPIHRLLLYYLNPPCQALFWPFLPTCWKWGCPHCHEVEMNICRKCRLYSCCGTSLKIPLGSHTDLVQRVSGRALMSLNHPEQPHPVLHPFPRARSPFKLSQGGLNSLFRCVGGA